MGKRINGTGKGAGGVGGKEVLLFSDGTGEGEMVGEEEFFLPDGSLQMKKRILLLSLLSGKA